jgi:hypothetical protein
MKIRDVSGWVMFIFGALAFLPGIDWLDLLPFLGLKL